MPRVAAATAAAVAVCTMASVTSVANIFQRLHCAPLGDVGVILAAENAIVYKAVTATTADFRVYASPFAKELLETEKHTSCFMAIASRR